MIELSDYPPLSLYCTTVNHFDTNCKGWSCATEKSVLPLVFKTDFV